MDQDVLHRMKEVERAVLELHESVRAPAFEMMRSYIVGGKLGDRDPSSTSLQNGEPQRQEDVRPDLGECKSFMDRHESGNPADNAKAIAGFLYGLYGLDPFAIEEIEELAAEAGVTIPSRLDMTFLGARHERKTMFKRAGRGCFRPTVHAEAYFRETFGVRKGTQKRSLITHDAG